MIKAGLADWENPLAPEELAGLALEDQIESRLISCVDSDDGGSQWQLAHGPFTEDQFNDLPTSHWSLLVQAVDHFVPAVAELRDYFHFIPRWQVDDVMVSYATPGGGVGPHFDRYDVFLVQGQGSRQWQIGQRCNAETEQQFAGGLSLLTEFEESDSYTLEAGDILYVPPYLAHWGTSLDHDCMTYSVGFRAPAMAELIDDFATYIQTQLSDDDRFRAPLEAIEAASPAGIEASALDAVGDALATLVSDPEHLRHWFGSWASQPRDIHEATESLVGEEEEQELLAILSDEQASETTIHKDGSARYYYCFSQQDNLLLMFANGRCIEIEEPEDSLLHSVLALCECQQLEASSLQPWLDNEELRDALIIMFDRGELYFE